MDITLKPEPLKWLEEQVAAGAYASIDDAVHIAVAGLMAIETDDLAWAKPLVDEARASIARGEGMKAADVKAETEAYLRSLGA